LQKLSELRDGKLAGTRFLKLSEGLEEFPREIFDLSDTLEYLDLSSNLLSTLPEDFGRLSKLKIFFASDNRFSILPKVLGDCPDLDILGFKANFISEIPAVSLNINLRWLILTNNQIPSLPDEIGNCKRLEKLMLAGNALKSLPERMKDCRSLSLLRISANQLTELPGWIYELPQLAWLAFSGNPIFSQPPIRSISLVHANSIRLGTVLGEGASGTIYEAYIDSNGSDAVALKIFKGDLTSDGYPEDEMQTFIAAGFHPSLVRLLAKVNEGIDGRQAIIMELIPASFYNLGRPPSLKTCTRDVFDEKLKLTSVQMMSILKSMASVSAHLHANGISHGDLYAHNILINNKGEVRFGDFGAASLYDNRINSFIEKIEVKAYGFLLEDLIGLTGIEGNLLRELLKLKGQCLSSDIQNRPVFKKIVEKLNNLKIY